MMTTLRSRTARTAAIGLTLATILALSACAASAPEVTSPSAAPETSEVPTVSAPEPSATASATPEAPIVVPEELEFSTTIVTSGDALEGTSLAGKNTVLWFWAPWCPICQAESGTVAKAMAELPDDVTMIGVAGQSDVPAMQEFIDNFGVEGFEHIADVDGSVWASFGVTYQPAFAFIDADGTVTTVPGSLPRSEIVERANELVS